MPSLFNRIFGKKKKEEADGEKKEDDEKKEEEEKDKEKDQEEKEEGKDKEEKKEGEDETAASTDTKAPPAATAEEKPADQGAGSSAPAVAAPPPPAVPSASTPPAAVSPPTSPPAGAVAPPGAFAQPPAATAAQPGTPGEQSVASSGSIPPKPFVRVPSAGQQGPHPMRGGAGPPGHHYHHNQHHFHPSQMPPGGQHHHHQHHFPAPPFMMRGGMRGGMVMPGVKGPPPGMWGKYPPGSGPPSRPSSLALGDAGALAEVQSEGGLEKAGSSEIVAEQPAAEQPKQEPSPQTAEQTTAVAAAPPTAEAAAPTAPPTADVAVEEKKPAEEAKESTAKKEETPPLAVPAHHAISGRASVTTEETDTEDVEFFESETETPGEASGAEDTGKTEPEPPAATKREPTPEKKSETPERQTTPPAAPSAAVAEAEKETKIVGKEERDESQQPPQDEGRGKEVEKVQERPRRMKPKKKHHRPPSSQDTAPTSEIVATNGIEEKSVQRVAMDPVTRKLFLQRVAKLLSQQQYHGKVEKLKGLKMFSHQPLSSVDSLLLAVPSSLPSMTVASIDLQRTLFYPQVQLEEELAEPNEDRTLTTHLFIFEGNPGRMLFATGDTDIPRQFENGADSCFVTSRSGISFRDATHVVPIGEVDVIWTPAREVENTLCPRHKAPLQLYNPDQRELCCALCYANSPFHQHLVVLDDILQFTSGGKTLITRLEEKRSFTEEVVRQSVQTHTQVASVAQRKREAVQTQFDLLMAAVEARRKQVLEEIAVEETVLQTDLAKEILTAQESIRHLTAAVDTLRTTGPTPKLAELSTIASARDLEAHEPPKSVADPFHGYNVSLEGIIEAVQQAPLRKGSQQGYESSFRYVSPSRSGRTPTTSKISFAGRPESPQRSSPYRTNGSRLGKNRLPSEIVQASAVSHLVDGTCVFNCPLQELVSLSLKKQMMVEWRLRIDDHGDWLGVGVAVGSDVKTLASGAVVDTKHMWIAPAHFPRVLRIRVVVGPHHSAKLTIHDVNGQQLDDNRVPHWAYNRAAFPQISFGQVSGKVTMLEVPKLVALRTSR